MNKNKARKTYYITTPIYYPSDKWHIGHCYTTVCCDALSRYKRMTGHDVYFLTGTDEHGQKIQKRAVQAGVSPKEFTDKLVDEIKELWKLLDISNDGFIRTTDEFHKSAVQKIFTRLYDQGDIYKSKYKGKYCTPCESFWTDTQAKDGLCPDCGREVTSAEEECYFFRLSKYADRVKTLLTTTPYLSPQIRVNEMVNNFLSGEKEDLAVTRTSFDWGIPVPFDPKHTVYVWIDALSNYITALGYEGEDDTLFKKYWPCSLHVTGKEIVRFHAIIWPALLMALNIPLPERMFGHGWIMFGGEKMSKSKGNVVDPFILSERYSSDSVRYFLLREISFGQDSNYSTELFLSRINADLANDLGNLVKRTLAMSRQYFDGNVVKGTKAADDDADNSLIIAINSLGQEIETQITSLNINKAVEAVLSLVGKANKYIDVTKPWELNKNGEAERLKTAIYNLLEAIRVAAAYLIPFLTKTPARIFEGLNKPLPVNFETCVYGNEKSYNTKEIETLFPRIDIKKELEDLAVKTVETAENKEEIKMDDNKEIKNEITIDEFFKTELKTALVTACEKVEKSDKLLKLTLSVGAETRTVVSGIAKSYSAEQMIGKSVVLVYNLKKAKLRGIESEGMILCASDDEGNLVLVSPESAIKHGSEVC